MKSVSCLQTGAVCEIMSFWQRTTFFSFCGIQKKCSRICLKEIPIVMLMLSEQQDLSGRYGVAHYLSELATMEKAAEIIEAYCVGRKKHDVLLLDEYGEKSAAALLTLGRQNLTCFEVHDLGGAKAYLKKNFPRCVCLYLPYEQCQEIQPQLKHDKIFYVENPRNLENLATLLQ